MKHKTGKKSLEKIAFTSLFLFLFITVGISFKLSSTHALSVSDVSTSTRSVLAAVTVAEACTIDATVNTPHTTSISPGTSRGLGNSGGTDGIGQTTIKVTCNDSSGYAIYAVGYSNNTFGNTNLIGRSSGNTITTGTSTSGTTSNWAMQVNAVSGTYAPTIQNSFNSSSYHVVPVSYTMVAKRTSGTDAGTGAVGSSITTTYGAYITSNQLADTYEGKVKYTLVHPNNYGEPPSPHTATSGCINYFANAPNAVGTMGCQSIASNATTATLLASNFSRDGYGFAGWSDSYDYATNSNAKFYGPQEDITFTARQYTGSNPGLSLYAVWVKSAGSLQDSTKVSQLCGTGSGSLTTAPTDGTANLSSVSALTDARDNQTYAIAKLADGKCWMIENLRLEAGSTRTAEKQALAQGYGTSATYGNFGGLADAESANFSNSTTANSLYYSGTQSGTATINIGTGGSPGYRFPRYNNTNTQSRASNPTDNTGAMYSYGNYYTWHAAIADLTYNGTNNSSVTNTSLCPSGWHLPKGGDKSNEANNDFWSLIVTGINGGTNPANYESSTYPYYIDPPEGSDISKAIRAYPNNFLYSDDFYTSSANNKGSSGFYWSSTAYTSYFSYTLYLDSITMRPGTNGQNKHNGYSIRCTAGT